MSQEIGTKIVEVEGAFRTAGRLADRGASREQVVGIVPDLLRAGMPANDEIRKVTSEEKPAHRPRRWRNIS